VHGWGLELALACHYRVALGDAQIALPEVKLGLLPGAGGTQRLPRVVGVETALNMIVSGEPVPAKKLEGTALFERVVDGNLLDAALELAQASTSRPLKKVRDLKIDYPKAEAFFQFARNTVGAMSKNFPAPAKCIDAVAAAVSKPFDEGMAVERAFFEELVQTTESKALRHAFFGERAAAKIADVPEGTPTRKIAKVGVIGAGLMGGGIAMNFLNAGIAVVLLEVKQEALEKGIGQIRKNYEGTLKKGKLSQDSWTRAWADHAHALVRRVQGRGPGDRGGVRGHRREGEGVQDARRGVQARRDPGQQHLHLNMDKIAASPSAPATWWACTSSAQPT
jgi:3-hydroxyacyl-CoA dehydrogenase